MSNDDLIILIDNYRFRMKCHALATKFITISNSNTNDLLCPSVDKDLLEFVKSFEFELKK